MGDRRYPNGKYVVFKVEDWEVVKRLIGASNYSSIVAHRMIDDSTVIRGQDVFAAPALDAYANSMKISVETMKQLSAATGLDLEPEIEHLEEVIDFFQSQADMAWHHPHRKLPD